MIPKFKAWHKKWNKWVHDELDIYINSDGEVIHYYHHAYEVGSHNITNDVEICFYTGKIDKNGKEIYEGDIVHCVSRMDEGNLVVIFQEGEFIMKLHPSNHGYYAIRNFTKEVVGNIYEPITV